jgi:DNA-binding transcriptional MerR regulator
MTKSTGAFRTISEVADELDVQKHVLRFWENKFPQVRPMKRGGGRRYYRPDDLDLLRGIRFLLHREGYTIKGVQKLLREQGLEYVKTCWQPITAAAVVAPATDTAAVAAKPTRKGRSAGGAAVAAKQMKSASAPFGLQPAAFNRQEHLIRLQKLVAELEDCRRLLRGEQVSKQTGIVQRAVK